MRLNRINYTYKLYETIKETFNEMSIVKFGRNVFDFHFYYDENHELVSIFSTESHTDQLGYTIILACKEGDKIFIPKFQRQMMVNHFNKCVENMIHEE
jgi:hypothetical protein